jgi:hypothetical protein
MGSRGGRICVVRSVETRMSPLLVVMVVQRLSRSSWMRTWISTRIGQTEVNRARLLDSIRSLLRVWQSINWHRFLGREKITDTFRTLKKENSLGGIQFSEAC